MPLGIQEVLSGVGDFQTSTCSSEWKILWGVRKELEGKKYGDMFIQNILSACMTFSNNKKLKGFNQT